MATAGYAVKTTCYKTCFAGAVAGLLLFAVCALGEREQTSAFEGRGQSYDAYTEAFGLGETDVYGPHYEEGSLWSQSSGFNNPFGKQVVQQYAIGEIVVVKLKENFQSQDDLQVKNETEATLDFQVGKLWSNSLDRRLFGSSNGAVDYPGIDITGTDDYDGKSRGTRKSSLTIDIPCTVKKVYPDGRMLLEGRASRIIGRDKKSFIFSGLVRADDIDPNSRVIDGSRVAESQLRWEGKGPGQGVAHPGLLSRLMDFIPLF